MTADEFNKKYFAFATPDVNFARKECALANQVLEDGYRAVVVNFGESFAVMLAEAAEIACATVGATVEEQG